MPVTYDQDADEVHAPGSHDSLGVSSQQAAKEVDALEKQYAADSAPDPQTGKSNDASKLKEDEEAPDRSGFSAADDINEKLGKGYTGKGSTKSKGLARLYSSKSKTKKKMAIAGAASGGSILLGIIVFIAMLPLKVEAVIAQLDAKFTSATTQAVSKEGENLFSAYVKNSLFPMFNRTTCTSTISPHCAPHEAGSGPIGKLYASWKKDRLDQKLAKDYGIVIGKHSNGHFVLNMNGKDLDISKLQNGDENLFHLLDTNHNASNKDFHAAINKALEGETKWKAAYKRFFITKRIDKLLGTNLHCIVLCDTRTKLSQSRANKKLAAKLWLAQKVVGPLSESYGVLITCMLSPDTCDAHLNKRSEDGRPESAVSQKVNDAIASFVASHSETDLAKLAEKASDLSRLGVGGYLTKVVAQKIADLVGKEGSKEVVGTAVDKAVPIVGWISLAITLREFVDKGPDAVKFLIYTSHAAAAAQTYSTYRTLVDEIHHGNSDATEVGSFTDALGSASDIGTTHSDATSTPLYSYLMGGPNDPQVNAASLFGATTPAKDTSYKCNDGKPVPAGKLVCSEEDFGNAGWVANAFASIRNNPAVAAYFDATAVIERPLSIANDIYQSVGGFLGGGITFLCQHAPLCGTALKWVSGIAGTFFNWVFKELIPNPFGDLSGGRTVDMIAAGDDVTQNKACVEIIGCSKQSDQTIADIQNAQATQDKADFNSQSLFARMFSTDTPYSLVDRMAAGMPTSMLGVSNSSLASIMSNPVSKLGSMFSAVFSSNHAFAAATPQADPFSVQQMGYSPSQVPKNPQAYWDANCVNGPMATYDDSTGKLDTSKWYDAQQQDQNSGESYASTPNACMLIQTSIISTGAAFDSSLVPADLLTTDAASSSAVGASTYRNPIIKSNAPDPAIIEDGNGTYYLYATGCPAFQKFKSTDLVTWTKAGNGLSNPPGWMNGHCWAPDVTKVGSKYIMTFSGGTCSSGMKIGYATASTAAGPFNYQGILVDDQSSGCGYDIDPDLEVMNGQPILYYGSGRSYISAREVTISGNHLSAGGQHRIDVGQSAEGSWVIHRGSYYYLFYSTGSYTNATYAVHVARSTSPMSGFHNDPRAVLTTGNGFSGPGHNTIITDYAGVDWIAYICYNSNDVGGTRNVCLDKVTYTNGWPTVNDGHPSNSTMPAPITKNGGGAVTGTNGKIVVGEYNILNGPGYSHDKGRVYGTTDDRAALQAKIVRGTAGPQHDPFDVLITNEETPEMYAAQKKYLTEYSSVEKSEFAIFWNSSKFNEITHGTSTQWGGGGRFIDAPWVKLQTTDGQTITLTAVHYSSFTQYNYSDANIRKAANYTLGWVRQQNDGKSIVIFGGDLGEHKDIPAGIFNSSGLVNNSKFMAEGKTATGSQSAPGGADQIYITPLSGLTASDWHNAPRTGIIMQSSDHSPTWVTLKYRSAR